jgi:hypothetical protein
LMIDGAALPAPTLKRRSRMGRRCHGGRPHSLHGPAPAATARRDLSATERLYLEGGFRPPRQANLGPHA